MSQLNTSHPLALQYFLRETLFDVGMDLPVPQQPEVGVSPAVPAPIPYLGKNQKNILFVVWREGGAFFSAESELAFLKTLQALRMDLNDVSVINLQQLKRPVHFERIRKQFEPGSCIFLGVEPGEAGLEGFADHLWKEEQGLRLLKTYSFEEMLTDKQKKRMFWDAIKLIDPS